MTRLARIAPTDPAEYVETQDQFSNGTTGSIR